MTSIHVLDEDTINKIAAGEVVGRPVSVVKELVENAIDAKATSIRIEAYRGGKSMIKIMDNGVGMSVNDAPLSLVRHATSKIKSIEDLMFIESMGFRGEALPSIASVSRFTLQSQEPQSNTGIEIFVEGGIEVHQKELPLNRGTTLIVKDLFYNVPARLKFLKTDKTELQHILKLLTGLAMIHPEIAFQFYHDKQKILSTPGTGKLEDVLSTVYGFEIYRAMQPIFFEDNGIQIQGMVTGPDKSRTDRDKQVFAVNHRLVQSTLLSGAVKNALQFIFPQNRHPYLFLHIEVDSSECDVNVHPSKLEVKLQQEQFVFKSTLHALKSAFKMVEPATPTRSTMTAGTPNGKAFPSSPQASSFQQSQVRHTADTLFKTEPLETIPAQPVIPSTEPAAITGRPPLNPAESLPILQIDQTFLVFYEQDQLLIIDQHIAHERVIFEQLRQTDTSRASQELLIPETIFLDLSEQQMLKEMKNFLEELGYRLDSMGEDSLIVRAVPQTLMNVDHRDLIRELLSVSGSTPLKQRHEKLLTTIACKAAIKAGQTLSQSEMIRLIKDWKETPHNMSCPHGRPIVKIMPKSEIKKWFNR